MKDIKKKEKSNIEIRKFKRTIKQGIGKTQDINKNIKDKAEQAVNSNENVYNYAVKNIEDTGKKTANRGYEVFTSTRKNPIKKFNNAKDGISSTRQQWRNVKYNISDSKRTIKKNVSEIKKSSNVTTEVGKGTIKTKPLNFTKPDSKTAGKATRDIGKTSGKVAIKTERAVRNSTVTASKMAVKAKQGARVMAEYGRATVRSMRAIGTAVKMTAQATIVAVKSGVALIAAGGWIVVLIIIVIAIMAFAFRNFGVLEPEDSAVMSQAIASLNQDFNDNIDSIVAKHSEYQKLVINNEDWFEDFQHWERVLPLYNVLCVKNGLPSYGVSEANIALLRQTMWDMLIVTDTIKDEITYRKFTYTDEYGNVTETVEEIHTIVLVVDVEYKEALSMATEYNFSNDEQELLNELLKPEYIPYYYKVIDGL